METVGLPQVSHLASLALGAALMYLVLKTTARRARPPPPPPPPPPRARREGSGGGGGRRTKTRGRAQATAAAAAAAAAPRRTPLQAQILVRVIESMEDGEIDLVIDAYQARHAGRAPTMPQLEAEIFQSDRMQQQLARDMSEYRLELDRWIGRRLAAFDERQPEVHRSLELRRPAAAATADCADADAAQCLRHQFARMLEDTAMGMFSERQQHLLQGAADAQRWADEDTEEEADPTVPGDADGPAANSAGDHAPPAGHLVQLGGNALVVRCILACLDVRSMGRAATAHRHVFAEVFQSCCTAATVPACVARRASAGSIAEAWFATTLSDKVRRALRRRREVGDPVERRVFDAVCRWRRLKCELRREQIHEEQEEEEEAGNAARFIARVARGDARAVSADLMSFGTYFELEASSPAIREDEFRMYFGASPSCSVPLAAGNLGSPCAQPPQQPGRGGVNAHCVTPLHAVMIRSGRHLLSMSCDNDDLELQREFLRRLGQDSEGECELAMVHKPVELDGQIETFCLLLAHGADLQFSPRGAYGNVLDIAVANLDLRMVRFLVLECGMPADEPGTHNLQWTPTVDDYVVDVFCACPRLVAMGEAAPEGWDFPKQCAFTPVRNFLLSHGAHDHQMCRWDLRIERAIEFVRAQQHEQPSGGSGRVFDVDTL